MASYQENFYKTEPDCLRAGQQLTKFAFYETHFTAWNEYGFSLPKESLGIYPSELKTYKKPYCIAELPFNMGSYDHFFVRLKQISFLTNEKKILVNFFFMLWSLFK